MSYSSLLQSQVCVAAIQIDVNTVLCAKLILMANHIAIVHLDLLESTVNTRTRVQLEKTNV